MAELILYMGPSGCGKTTSLRNLNPKETIIITPNGKSLPFPVKPGDYVKGKNLLTTNELDMLNPTITLISKDKPEIKYIIVEDFTHYFTARILSQTFLNRNTGNEAFQRWTDFGASVYQALFLNSSVWRDNLYIIILHHTDIKEDGSIGFKSAGKLLDNTIDIPSYFNYVFHGVIEQTEAGANYLIQTNRDTIRQAKTPYGLFPILRIPNDLQAILTRINDYKQGKLKITF